MKDKHFLIKQTAPYTRIEDTLELTRKNQSVTIHENWEYCPHIEIDFSNDFIFTPTEANKYVKVKRIIPEIFDSYYESTIKALRDSFLENGEYYYKYSTKNCKLHCYSDSRQIIISVDNEIDYFRCSISRYNSPRGRHYDRKNMDTLPEERMKQLFKLTLELLFDYNSFKNLNQEYYKQLTLLIQEEKPVEGLVLNANVSFIEVRIQIEQRIAYIENRLIKFDDTIENRNELRGELNGLRYSLKLLE